MYRKFSLKTVLMLPKIMFVGLQTKPRMAHRVVFLFNCHRHHILEFTFVHVPVGNYIGVDVYKYARASGTNVTCSCFLFVDRWL